VLGLTALGMCITALGVYLFPNVDVGVSRIAFFASFILLIIMQFVRRNGALALVLFYAFTFLEGIFLSPIVGYYAHTAGNEVVFNAALTTGLGMFALGAVVYATGLDLRRFQGIFLIGLLALVVLGIISFWWHVITPTAYSWGILVIFTGLVLIDFARLRAGGDGLTPVQMAVSIYLDAINIFLAILQLTGGGGGRRSNN
jgi:modulator of FtsH protease